MIFRPVVYYSAKLASHAALSGPKGLPYKACNARLIAEWPPLVYARSLPGTRPAAPSHWPRGHQMLQQPQQCGHGRPLSRTPRPLLLLHL